MKKFLRQLTAKDIRRYLFLLLIAGFGIWLKGFAGGLITGAAGISLILIVIGKAVFASTVRRIDKTVKDTLLNQ